MVQTHLHMKLYAYPHASYRNRILYPLQLGPPFPNVGNILKPKVGLEPDHIEIDLRKAFKENITLL